MKFTLAFILSLLCTLAGLAENPTQAKTTRDLLPYRLAVSDIPGRNDPNQCFEYAVNLQYRLNQETDVKAIIWTFKVLDYKIMQMWGHAVVLWFTPNNEVWGCDNNVGVPAKLDLNAVDFGKPDWDNKLLHEFIKKVYVGDADAQGHETLLVVLQNEFLYGKRDVLDHYGPHSQEYYAIGQHPSYMPPTYCND